MSDDFYSERTVYHSTTPSSYTSNYLSLIVINRNF